MGEFDFIDRFLAAFAEAGGELSGREVLLGPGDDCALLASPAPLAITTDAVVEGVHFRRDWASWAEIGHKALAVNLSDLAAMGARPVAFLCALAVPRELDEAALLELARGMAPLARQHGAVLCGGNVTRATQLSITITALGAVEGRPLRRDTARPGDVVMLLGDRLGEAAAELRTLQRGGSIPPGHSALHRPQPLCREGVVAATQLSCAIDLSDGLVQDLGHIASASGVRLRIDARRLPRSERFGQLTVGMPEEEQLSLLLAGGEEYILALCGPAEAATALGACLIGQVEEGRGVTIDNAPMGVRLQGFDHLS